MYIIDIYGNEALFIYIYSLDVAREQGYVPGLWDQYKIPHSQVKQHIKYVHIYTYVAMRRHKLRIIRGSEALRRLPTQKPRQEKLVVQGQRSRGRGPRRDSRARGPGLGAMAHLCKQLTGINNKSMRPSYMN